MKHCFKLTLWVLSIALFVGVSLTTAMADENDNNVKIYVKGKFLESADYTIKDNRTFLPLRLIGETLGYEVQYIKDSQEIVISNTSKTIKMKLGHKSYAINDKKLEMDVVPFVVNSKTFVPVRFIAESFDEPVDWDGINRTVIVASFIEPDLTIGKEVDLKTEELDFSLQCSDEFDKAIAYSVKKDAVQFFDLFNKEKSEDKSSGSLLCVLKSKSPQTVNVPGILLNYDNGIYIEAIFETGLEYSLATNEFKENYEKSKEILLKALKTFKLKNK